MLKLFILLILMAPRWAISDTITKGMSTGYLKKISKDGEIKNIYINELSSEVAFHTDNKLWLWKMTSRELKSIDIQRGGIRPNRIKKIKYIKPYWVVESHNKLSLINTDTNSTKSIQHPSLRQGKSIDVLPSKNNIFWAHTDGSFEIDTNSFDSGLILKSIDEDIQLSAATSGVIYYSRDKLLFRVDSEGTKLIYHSPRRIRELRTNENYLVLSTSKAVVQISRRGQVLKSIPQSNRDIIEKFRISKSNYHCYLMESGQIRSFNLTSSEQSVFKLPEDFEIRDFDCRGDLAVVSNGENLVLLINDSTKSYSIKQSRRQQFLR